MSIKGATSLLDRFSAEGIVVEVTHRSGRRLFGLKGLAPLRTVVRPPYRPDPNRGRGQPMRVKLNEPDAVAPPPLGPTERREFDYTALEEAMTHIDVVVRRARQQMTAHATGPGQCADDER